MPLNPTSEHVALAVLTASVASTVLTSVILADGWKRHTYGAAAGLLAGIIFRLTPAGQKAEGLHQYTSQPLLWVLFALGLSVIADLLLSSKLPFFGGLRARGRRALRASRWGTAEEIADGLQYASNPGILRLLGIGVEPTPMSPERLLARLRITANVVCGSCIGLFFVLPTFRHALGETLTLSHIAINLIATAFGTFFIGPLHEQVMHLSTSSHTSDAHPPAPDRADHRRLGLRIGIFALVALLLLMLQALHGAAHEALLNMNAYQWIILLEACALPLIVTTYYFGAALHRAELGNVRWDRALGASVWFGAIVLLPFTFAAMLPGASALGLREWLFSSVPEAGARSLNLIVLGLLLAYVSVLIAVVIAVVASWATYGIYALALGLAMTDAKPANARIRGCVAIVIAGAVVQAITSAAVSWWQVPLDDLHYIHLALAVGWACGLFLSHFEREMEPDAA